MIQEPDLFTYAESKIDPSFHPNNLRHKADEWIEENPALYDLFKSYARDLFNSGEKFSVKLIAERVRWEVRVQWKGTFKISNDLVAYVGRKMVEDIPELKAVFKFKKTRW